MPGAAINDSLWAEMTAAQKSEAVRAGRASLRQMVEGLLDGPDELGRACREVLARTDASLKSLTDFQLSNRECPDGDSAEESPDYQFEQQDLETIRESDPTQKQITSNSTHKRGINVAKRRRLGLPRGYLPRLRRH